MLRLISQLFAVMDRDTGPSKPEASVKNITSWCNRSNISDKVCISCFPSRQIKVASTKINKKESNKTKNFLSYFQFNLFY